MATNNFLPGDRVRFEGTIIQAEAETGTVWVSPSVGNYRITPECLYVDNLTLVERPEPKVSVEISLETIDKICQAAIKTGDSSKGSGWDLADNIRNEVLEKLNGND